MSETNNKPMLSKFFELSNEGSVGNLHKNILQE